MKQRNVSLLVLGAALALAGPAAAGAQERGTPDPGRASTIVHVDARPGWLGISLDLPRETGPVRVDGVVPGSPAARAGVARGDTVLALNGAAATVEAMRGLSPEPGDTVRLRLRRDGRNREVRVVAAPRASNVLVIRRGDDVTVIDPDSVHRRMAIRLDTVRAHLDSLFVRVDSLRLGTEARRLFRSMPIRVDSIMVGAMAQTIPFSIEVGSRALAGAEFTQMNEGLGRYFRTEEGLLTLRVAPESPAARAGLEPGDVVTKVNGTAVETLRDLRQAVAQAGEPSAKLEVFREGSRRELTLRWERGTQEMRIYHRSAPERPATR